MGLFYDRSQKLEFCNLTFQTLKNKSTIQATVNQDGNNIQLGSLLGIIKFERDRDLDTIVDYFRSLANFLERNVVQIMDLPEEIKAVIMQKNQAINLVKLAMHLRQYGENAPGGNETWKQWDIDAENFVRTIFPFNNKHYKESQLHYLKKFYKAALELLQQLGWYPFGYHADHNPIPTLEFSKQVDETGDPYFERPIK